MGGRSFRRFSDAVNEENCIWNEISRKTAPLFAAFIIALELGVVLIVPIGGRLFMHGSITSSVFLLFAYVGSLYLTELLPLQQLGMQLAQALNGVGKVKEILDIPIFEGSVDFPEKHDIDIRGVSFSYNEENEVLHNCNMRINEGETVAVVGASGAGKSTIVQLISRFYDVSGGEIKIGGTNVKDIGYEQLLKNVSIVFQKTFLTSDSVLGNIRMGSDATLEEVREAAKHAQIDDFIMSLPDGYNTNVGSFGTRFSGGEKQRIRYTVHFSMPDKSIRARIWRSLFTDSLPHDEIDFGLLSDKLELSGAEIKNIMLGAMIKAASEKIPLNMKHILSCASEEYDKLENHIFAQKILGYTRSMLCGLP